MYTSTVALTTYTTEVILNMTVVGQWWKDIVTYGGHAFVGWRRTCEFNVQLCCPPSQGHIRAYRSRSSVAQEPLRAGSSDGMACQLC